MDLRSLCIGKTWTFREVHAMPARASDGTSLPKLVKIAIPICRRAQRQCPRTGPGRPPNFQDWKMAVLIMAAILKRRKSKSAQYRFLHEHRSYTRRSLSVEPFNEWFKSLFGLSQTVWHRGLENNRTQLLGAIFCYQLLLCYNRRCGNKNGQVQWILDTL